MSPGNIPGSQSGLTNQFDLSRVGFAGISWPSNTDGCALVDLRKKFARIRGIYFFLFFII